MRKAIDYNKKIPHPEEAAKRPSRRTHGARPSNTVPRDLLDPVIDYFKPQRVILFGSLALSVYLTPRLFSLASKLEASAVLLAFGLVFCFALAGLASIIGLAPIVGAFVGGFAVDTFPERHCGVGAKHRSRRKAAAFHAADRGVELGSNLAEVVRRKLAPFEHAEVVTADFDDWVLPVEPFDMVVAATAFHWLDPARRVRKCAEALRPGGALAIIETHWGLGHGDDKFFAESQSCYARWDADHNPAFRPPTLEELSEERDDLASSQLFSQIMHSRYLCDREYDAVQYCDLLGTFSNVLAFDERTRSGFLACIADLIESRFGGRIVRHDLYDLWLARTSTRSGSR